MGPRGPITPLLRRHLLVGTHLWHDARMTGRDVVDELTFLLVRVAVVAVPAGIGWSTAGTAGLAVGFVVGLVAAALFWSWTTASGARAAARTDLDAVAEPPADEAGGQQAGGVTD